MKIIATRMAVILTLALLLSIVAPASALESRAASGRTAAAAPAPAQGPTDPAELEAFLDGLLAQEMQEYHIAGAAVSVVKDGKLFFTKGYGYADLNEGVPVDPEQTIFRIGSVGKTFTWTAPLVREWGVGCQ